jgi:hypothetical protein
MLRTERCRPGMWRTERRGSWLVDWAVCLALPFAWSTVVVNDNGRDMAESKDGLQRQWWGLIVSSFIFDINFEDLDPLTAGFASDKPVVDLSRHGHGKLMSIIRLLHGLVAAHGVGDGRPLEIKCKGIAFKLLELFVLVGQRWSDCFICRKEYRRKGYSISVGLLVVRDIRGAGQAARLNSNRRRDSTSTIEVRLRFRSAKAADCLPFGQLNARKETTRCPIIHVVLEEDLR